MKTGGTTLGLPPPRESELSPPNTNNNNTNSDNNTHNSNNNNNIDNRKARRPRKQKKTPSLKKLTIYATNALKEPIPGSLRRRRKKWLKLAAPVSALVWRVLSKGAPLLFQGRKPPPRTLKARPLEPSMQQIVKDFIRDGLLTGEIEECSKKPLVLSPLFVIPKKNEGEWRVIIDLRYVNRFQHVNKFRFEDLATVAELLRPGDWMTSLDFKSGFFHAEVQQEFREYLGFQHLGRFYRYRVIPFGSSSSPLVFTKLVRPAIEHLRQQGIRIVAYMDDILIIAPSKEQADLHTRMAMDLLLSLGWKIRLDKSELEPAQNRVFLGMLLDTTGTLPVIRVPYNKKRKIYREVKRLIAAAEQGPVKRRRIAQVAGLCNAVSKAISSTKALTRNLLRAAGNRSQVKNAWNQAVRVPKEAINDLLWWLEFLENWNGRTLLPPPTSATLETDASNLGWGAHIQGKPLEAAGAWPRSLASTHINLRELTAVELALRTFKKELRGQTIRVNTDNQVTLSYLKNFTGRKEELEKVARRIMKLCLEHEITIIPYYIPGETNTTADRLSRLLDPHDWVTKQEPFLRICKRWGAPTVDRFASHLNNKVPRFNSRYWCPGCEAVDAMSTPWKGELNFLCPPIRMIPAVLRKCQLEEAEAILIAPVWRAQPWFQTLQSLLVDSPIPINPKKDLERGPSGRMEPLANPKWKFAAFRIAGSKHSLAGMKELEEESSHPSKEVASTPIWRDGSSSRMQGESTPSLRVAKSSIPSQHFWRTS